MSLEKGSSNRSFGLVFAAFFTIVALGPLVRHHTPRLWALVPAGIFLVLAIVYPKVLSPLNRAWTLFGLVLSKIMNPIIMGVFYYILLTPWAVIMRKLGKDPLELRWDSKRDTYWITREGSEKAINMENQF